MKTKLPILILSGALTVGLAVSAFLFDNPLLFLAMMVWAVIFGVNVPCKRKPRIPKPYSAIGIVENDPDLSDRPYYVAYLAGPYRAPNAWGIVNNIRKAELAALLLWKWGFAVICPHKNTALYDGSLDDNAWLEGDLAMVGKCDLLILMPDWRKSTGTRKERRYALARDIPVYDLGSEADCAVLQHLGSVPHKGAIWAPHR